MNADLHTALLTSDQCTCERVIDEDGDEYIPRVLFVRNPACVDHGVNAARVLPPLDVINEAWEGIRA